MGSLVSFFTGLHTGTKRDYLARMQDSKVECMEVALRYGQEYWDGPRRYGYGGYVYDGRQKPMAQAFIEHYGLGSGARILDAGCGKAFLLHEIAALLPDCEAAGFDVSSYALEHAPEEIRPKLFRYAVQERLPYPDGHFDLVLCLNTLHNLEPFELEAALAEIARVGHRAYVCVESYRSSRELFNLQCWALTCQAFMSPRGWQWMFEKSGYHGDYEFIYFE